MPAAKTTRRLGAARAKPKGTPSEPLGEAPKAETPADSVDPVLTQPESTESPIAQAVAKAGPKAVRPLKAVKKAAAKTPIPADYAPDTDIQPAVVGATTPRRSGNTVPSRISLAEMPQIARVMYYSDPGMGKSIAMARMANLGKVIYIDAERRLKRKVLERHGVPVENLEVYHDASYSALEWIAIDVAERLDSGEPIIGLCWDSISETHRRLLRAIVDDGVYKAQRTGDPTLYKDPWHTSQDNWGDMTEQMRIVLRLYVDLPINLAVSALAKREKDTEGVRIAPAVSPAVGRDFAMYMDAIVHCRVEEFNVDGQTVEEYSGLTKPGGKWESKDSYGVLPKILIDPWFDRIIGYIDDTLASKTDPKQLAAIERRKKGGQIKAAEDKPGEDEPVEEE